MLGAFGLPTLLYQTDVLSNSGLVAQGRVMLYSIRCISASPQRRYVELFARNDVWMSGIKPQMVLQVEPNGLYDWHCHGTPREFLPGLTWIWSATNQTGMPAEPDCYLELQYIVSL